MMMPVSNVKSALEQTRLKLLDLTMRNKLLNYAKDGRKKRLVIVDELPDQIFSNLVYDENPMLFDAVPMPTKKEIEEIGKLPDIEWIAVRNGIKAVREAPEPRDEPFKQHTDNYIQTLHYPKEMEKILKKNFSDAKQAVEETGSNMLYLVIGFLEWYESDNSSIKRYAPLIMVPVQLERGELDKKSLTYRYKLSYTGEDIVPNLALREKLSWDFGAKLPDFEDDMTPEDYFKSLRPMLQNLPGFKVVREFSLDFLTFSKILMYLDLDEDHWPESKKISDNPILDKFFNGTQSSGMRFAEDYPIDNNEDADRIKLISDADSSQHSAIIDAMQGKNLVIEGPPGTGKSQTITNLIASALNEGKKVLFVAEKLAALDVVKSRLEEAGLGAFCLELHSHKSHKQRVFKDLEYRLNKRYSKPSQIERKISELKDIKKTLNSYAALIATVHQPSGLKYYDILWRAERYRLEDFTPPEYEKYD